MVDVVDAGVVCGCDEDVNVEATVVVGERGDVVVGAVLEVERVDVVSLGRRHLPPLHWPAIPSSVQAVPSSRVS